MNAPAKQDGKDLGFSDAFSQQKRVRLINKDGTFNVWRERKRMVDLFSYATVLEMPWPSLLVWIAAIFVLVDALFAICYFLLGEQAFAVAGPYTGLSRVWRCFFFSAHIDGDIVPVGLSAHVLVFAQSLVGWLMYPLATGLLFARFVKPIAKFRFSSSAAVRSTDAPALLLRITNLTRSELIQVEATVVMSYFDQTAHTRCYFPLTLERSRISFIPLTWTITHFIDSASPFKEMTEESFRAAGGEILVQIRAIDQASSQSIHQRASYTSEDLAWNAQFVNAIHHDEKTGLLRVDLDKFDGTVPA